jgi:uncharacterized protein
MPKAFNKGAKMTDATLQDKFNRLEQLLAEKQSLLIAFSGGVDSSFLLAVATKVLRENTVALMTISAATPPEDERQALALVDTLRVPLLKIRHDELAIPQYAANPKNRCYFCKNSLYAICKREAARLSLQTIADGVNIDDLGDYRPGLQAAEEYGITHPLVDAGFTKVDIRRGSKLLGLSTWDRAASPCLSSRVPYGSAITETMLSQIAQGEGFLRSQGFQEVRLRHHGKTSRIEITKKDLSSLISNDMIKKIGKKMKEIGFDHVGVDLAGYKMGNFNDIDSVK